MLAPSKKSYGKPRQHIKKHTHHFAENGPYSQSCGFSSSRVWIWNLDHKEGWMPKNWFFWIVVLEKAPDSPLDSKESNQSILKEINPEYSLEGLMAAVEAPVILATWCDELTHSTRPRCFEKLKAWEGGNREWNGWMASLIQWTWVWSNSGR